MRTLNVEVNETIYEIMFGQIQLEITGRCNMRCVHCRAAGEDAIDVGIEQIEKIMKFARTFSPPYAEVIVSGGEPLLHKQFPLVMKRIRDAGGDSVTLTTNGLLFDNKTVELFRDLEFKRLMLSVSLDSLNKVAHDQFRGFRGAFEGAQRAIKLMVAANLPNTVTSVRVTLRPQQLAEMERIADYVYNAGCQRVNFSTIHPSGRASDCPDLWMSKDEVKTFVETVIRLQSYYPKSFQVSTNDPLKCLLRKHHDIGNENERVFDGCAAGAATFNVGANGDMTPCALMNLPMMNIRDLTVEEMETAYQNSPIIHNLLEMNVKGKCSACSLRFQCGGCRARALTRAGDYLGEDPCCWK